MHQKQCRGQENQKELFCRGFGTFIRGYSTSTHGQFPCFIIVSKYTYIYIYKYLYINIRTYIYIYMQVYIYIYVDMYNCVTI